MREPFTTVDEEIYTVTATEYEKALTLLRETRDALGLCDCTFPVSCGMGHKCQRCIALARVDEFLKERT